MFRNVAAQVVAAVEKNGGAIACTKGLVLESQIYSDRATRYMADVDFMISPRDRSAAEAALNGLGYEIGNCDHVAECLRPYDRREELLYWLTPDHLPRRIARLDDPIAPFVELDFALSLTWHSSEYQLDMDDVMRGLGRVSPPGLRDGLPCLSVFYHFLFIVMHLFREAWIDPWDHPEKDVLLQKFMDVYHLMNQFSAELMAEHAPQRIRDTGLAKPVAWVLGHTDAIFGSDGLEQFGVADLATDEWLASAQAGQRDRLRWSGDIRERMLRRTSRSSFRSADRGD